MVPDFQPFKHPSKNIDSSGPLSSKAGPIADVEWVEEVVPVFGKITKVQKQEKDPQGGSTTLLIGLIVGGIVAAILYKSKVNIKEEKESKSLKNVEQKGTSDQVTVDNIIINVKRVVPPEVKTQKLIEKDYKQNIPVSVIKKEEKSEQAIKLDQVKSVPIKSNDQMKEKEKQQIESNEKLKRQQTEVKAQPKESACVKGPKVEPKKPSVKSTEHSKARRKLSEANVTNLEDPEWITKIKTFKITKSPKFNIASICEHGAMQNVADVLDLVELEKADDLKTTIRTAAADLNIEGANTSRLRITVVVDKTEEESVAKTMTIKEFMVSISNKIIEDAVKRVKEDCSMENIKHLAETIRKYRPESAEIKSTQGL